MVCIGLTSIKSKPTATAILFHIVLLQLKPKATTNKEEHRKEIAALQAKLMATPEANDAALNTPNVTATGTINRTYSYKIITMMLSSSSVQNVMGETKSHSVLKSENCKNI